MLRPITWLAGLFVVGCSGEPQVAECEPPAEMQESSPEECLERERSPLGARCSSNHDCESGFCFAEVDDWVCTETCTPALGCSLEGWNCVRSIGFSYVCAPPDANQCFDINLNFDPENCGECGNSCSADNAATACMDGLCRLLGCEDNYIDLDNSVETGCEYLCFGSPEASETCNSADDDCDGNIDEGFDQQNDVQNCGGCGVRCEFANAIPACLGGACALEACTAGFVDQDGDDSNGCERVEDCDVPEPESCDAVDNDCDGRLDEGELCDNDLVCSGGACVGREECNMADDDGDGVIDEDAEDCWNAVWRFVKVDQPPDRRARCYAITEGRPTTCSDVESEFGGPVFYLYKHEMPGTVALYAFDNPDHTYILTRADMEADLEILRSSRSFVPRRPEILGYIWADTENPPAGVWFDEGREVRLLRRYSHPEAGVHIYPNNDAEDPAAGGWTFEQNVGFVWGSRW